MIKKHKKASFFLSILLFVCVCLTSCGSNIKNCGLENFSEADSGVSLCKHFMPTGFIDLYDYENGDYYYSYSSKAPFVATCDKVLLYLQYDNETYALAKQYAMENLNLSETVIVEYNNYYFHDTFKENEDASSNRYPYHFMRFAYNDEKNTLVFLGFYVSMELYKQVDESIDDWDVFLKKYFGEAYDFSKT